MIEIRDVRIEDAEEILAILNPIIAARCYTALDTPFTVEQEREFIRTFPARGIFLAAVDATSSRIVGFQDVSPFADFTHAFDHVGVIGTFVDLELRRQGIARRLFAATFEAARGRATRNSSLTCAPTTRPGCKPTCGRASASSGRRSAKRKSTADTSTKSLLKRRSALPQALRHPDARHFMARSKAMRRPLDHLVAVLPIKRFRVD